MKLTPSKVITRRIEKILGFFQRESEAYAKLHHCFWFRTICKLTIFDSLKGIDADVRDDMKK